MTGDFEHISKPIGRMVDRLTRRPPMTELPAKLTVWIGHKVYRATVHEYTYRPGAIGTYGEVTLKLSEFIEFEDRTPNERDHWRGDQEKDDESA